MKKSVRKPAASRPHRATARVADLLEVIAAAPGGLFLRDLGERLKAPKSSLFPLLRTLVARGYLEQGAAGDYRMGHKVFELGMAALANRELPEVARPDLQGLMRATGEGVMLAVLAGDTAGIVYIDKVESPHSIRFSPRIGELRPLHATAAGKVFLAWMETERRETVLKSLKLVRLTERTVTSIAALRSAIDETRRRGICMNIDEAQPGGSAIAAPIFGRDGSVVAAVVLGAPTIRVKPRAKILAEEVRAAADAISKRLGGVAARAAAA